ncbi:MAG: hypothetical protein IKL73_05870 [Lachnospiraceae bacterium]|nr:hypothetical protein [Lachnospiraceae bacterium]
MEYERMVSYIYQCENEIRGKNAGYAKIELRDNKCRLYINIQSDINYVIGVYLYYYKEGKKERLFLGKARPVHGFVEYKDVLWADNINASGKDFFAFNGIVLAKAEDEPYEYITEWKDYEEVPLEENVKDSVEVELVEELEEEKVNIASEDKDLLNDIIDTGEAILAFEDDYYSPCVETTYEELLSTGKISTEALNNSFLLHGYYRYKHLLIGRVLDKENTIFIGVPGTYQSKEKMLAAAFGFENFRRSQRSDIRCPNFGYWCIELIIE